MKKLFIVSLIVTSGLFSGCAAVVQVPAMVSAKNASAHPATKNFVVGMSKNDTFNVVMRLLTGNARKISSNDRESGIIQGQINDNQVMVKVAGNGGNESTVDITVSYNKPLLYGDAKLEDDLNTLVTEITAATSTKVSPAAKVAPAAKTETVSVSSNGNNQGLTLEQAQAKLNDLGYQVGQPDGVMGRKTREQLKVFQKSRGISQTGKLDDKTVAELSK